MAKKKKPSDGGPKTTSEIVYIGVKGLFNPWLLAFALSCGLALVVVKLALLPPEDRKDYDAAADIATLVAAVNPYFWLGISLVTNLVLSIVLVVGWKRTRARIVQQGTTISNLMDRLDPNRLSSDNAFPSDADETKESDSDVTKG